MRSILILLLFSCASTRNVPRMPVSHNVRHSCLVFNRSNDRIDRFTQNCSSTQQSTGVITLHRGDAGVGMYDYPWWCSRWFVEVVMTSRGFCEVKWDNLGALHASYCADTREFFAPTRLKWVVVNSVSR